MADEATGSNGGVTRARDRRFLRTERAIRAAFLSLVERHDYRAVTVTAIARQADINRKTFYLHYDSVEAVADAFFREEADCLVRLLREDLSKKGPPINVALLYLSLSAGLAPSISRTRRIARHVPADVILSKIEGPLTEALIDDDSLGMSFMGPYLGYCVSFFIGGLLAMYRRWLTSDSEIPLEDISALANAAVFSGVTGILRDRPPSKPGTRPAQAGSQDVRGGDGGPSDHAART